MLSLLVEDSVLRLLKLPDKHKIQHYRSWILILFTPAIWTFLGKKKDLKLCPLRLQWFHCTEKPAPIAVYLDIHIMHMDGNVFKKTMVVNDFFL